MTHDSAVRTITSLLPEIEKKGAETVLRDYAVQEDLPPAQLEKLAQVFNTMRTVAHIEKAADRGSSVPLIDVPMLVVDYAVNDASEKAAAAPAKRVSASHSAAGVDLMSALRREMQDPKPSVKAAAAPAETVKVIVKAGEFFDTAYEVQADARLQMSKLASQIFNEAPKDSEGRVDLSSFVGDAVHTRSLDIVKKAFDYLSRSTRLEVMPVEIKAPIVKRAFHAGTKAAELMEAYVDEFTTYDVMSKLATAPPVDDYTDLTEEEQQELIARAMGRDAANPAERQGSDPATTQPGDAAFQNGATPQHRQRAEGEEESGGKGKSSGGGKDKKEAEGLSVRQILSGAAGAAMAPVTSAAGAVNSAAAKASDLLHNITTKERTNKAQMRTDLNVDDIRRAIHIRRMIGTDPVLREADPREVLDIYNAISRTNPDIASNMAALKLLLREAVSYEGLTLDAQKQLADVRKSTSEAEGKEADNIKRRYSVGGPLIPTSRKA